MNQIELVKSESYKKRKYFIDALFKLIFRLAGLISAIFIILIFLFILEKGIRVFLPGYEYGQQNFFEFLTGLQWRQDIGLYGVGFIIVNTLVTSLGAILISFPLSVLSALFIVKIAPKKISEVMATVVELLASIPSVVYGVFASGIIVQMVQTLADTLGVRSWGGNSMLAVILLLAIMIYPTITMLSIAAIRAVPKELEHGSLALGASPTQTNFKVVLTSAKSGIFAGLILGLGRAFGEATAVSMVAGNKMFGPTTNLFDITRTLTSTMLAGLKETTGLDYDIRFSVGIVLMVIILVTNYVINRVKARIGQSVS
ncbi:MAG TPA: phosphate ABC transporter permease subunit PstC [Erysipelothrix sp.]|nr:phosphate ABC transporter permease subunit PstC [Erysipelothrix sp.]